MKISFVRRRWSPTGGAENYLVRLATHLKGKGHHTTLVCEEWTNTSGTFDHVQTFPQKGSRSARPREFARQTNEFLADYETDCIFSLERGIVCDIYRAGDGVHRQWLAQRCKYKPLTGWIQNILNPKNTITSQLESGSFDPDITRQVIANSEMVKRDILRWFPYPEGRISVIRNGVDFDLFSSGDRQTGREALGIGRDEFILLLVGAGAERKGVKFARKVASIVKDARLIVIDSPPPCKLPHVYAAADVFLFPTLYDPFANVTLEAMSAGLPVITTEDNGGHEVIQSGDNGFIVPSADAIQEMAAYCFALMEKPVREKISASAKETARQCTLSQNVELTLQLCEKILARV